MPQAVAATGRLQWRDYTCALLPAHEPPVLDSTRLAAADCGSGPFPLLVARGMLPGASQQALLDDFPDYRSDEEKLRKRRRGRGSRLLKDLLGRLDRWLGAGRGRNASHQD